jgi:thiol-disulfide isomerase/thioredoxin
MKKFVREWIVILGVFGILYATGLHTEVIAFTQRIILSTGIIAPKKLNANEWERAIYDVELKSLSSEKIINLSDYRGKVIFMNFWASWCGPCIAEMPGIQNLYNKTDTTKVKFILISLDSQSGDAIQFLHRKNFDLPAFFPLSPLPEIYNPPAVPTTFIISPDGMVVSKTIGMADYNKKSFIKYLEELAGKK